MDGGISGISGEFIYDEMDDDWGSSNGVLTSFLFVGCLGWEIHGNTMPLVVPMAAFRKKKLTVLPRSLRGNGQNFGTMIES